MNPVGAAVIFFISWWLCFFCVLPIGVKGHYESDAEQIEGSESGAPVEPNLKQKALWALFGAVILTALVHFLIVPWLA